MNSANATMYKCKKAVTMSNYTQAICKWVGTLEEYIQHVKSDHGESYFYLTKEWSKFQWKLPFLGDQTDLGILEHSMGHFLYEIYYDESKLYFSLACLKQPLGKSAPCYELLLQNDSGTKCLKNLTCGDFGEITKPIQKQSHSIIIQRNVLSKYYDKTRIFQWYLNIAVGDASPVLN